MYCFHMHVDESIESTFRHTMNKVKRNNIERCSCKHFLESLNCVILCGCWKQVTELGEPKS